MYDKLNKKKKTTMFIDAKINSLSSTDRKHGIAAINTIMAKLIRAYYII